MKCIANLICKAVGGEGLISVKELDALKNKAVLLEDARDIISRSLEYIPLSSPLSDEINEFSKKLIYY